MKTLALVASAALLLAVPGLSLAQDEHRPDGEGRPGGAPHLQAPPQAPRPVGQPQAGPAFRNPAAQPYRGPAPGGPFQRGQFQGGPVQHGAPQAGVAQAGGRQPDFANGQPGRGDFNRGGGYNQGAPRPGSQAFGYGGHQYFRYRAAPYRFPGGYYGWADHSWRRGEWLPPVFITSSYFINDWYDFGLWQPDYGYQWIRVGADAVLINLADGQVVDVVPGVYYY